MGRREDRQEALVKKSQELQQMLEAMSSELSGFVEELQAENDRRHGKEHPR